MEVALAKFYGSISDMKTCKYCHETKPLDAFSPKRDHTDGRSNKCKACSTATTKAWYAENKDRALTQQAAWRDANRAQWNSRMAVATKKRQCAQLQRVPAWYDQAKVQEIYELAAEFRAAGFKVDVDHIVPLQAVEASGLHWHGNLRVCLTNHNRSKRNEMPRHHGALATPERKFVEHNALEGVSVARPQQRARATFTHQPADGAAVER